MLAVGAILILGLIGITLSRHGLISIAAKAPPTPVTPSLRATPRPTFTPSPTPTPVVVRIAQPTIELPILPRVVITPAPAPRMPPTRAPAPQRRMQVTAVGDSVMLAAAGELERGLDDVWVDAVDGRQVDEAIQVLRSLRSAGLLGSVVVVHIGNNGTFSDSQFDTMMDLLSEAGAVFFVNLKVPRRWEAENNAVLAAGVQRYPKAKLIDWHAASVYRPEFFWDDGVHLRPEGARAYADLVIRAVTGH